MRGAGRDGGEGEGCWARRYLLSPCRVSDPVSAPQAARGGLDLRSGKSSFLQAKDFSAQDVNGDLNPGSPRQETGP